MNSGDSRTKGRSYDPICGVPVENGDRTPGLGQVPLLKWLFKREQVSDQSTELLIFITPRIIKS